MRFPFFGRSLKGKVVLVTGASSGLGFILARRFVSAGARVTICSRSSEKLGQAAADLKARTGVGVRTIVCDVGDPASVSSMMSRIIRDNGRIDILVNNAGIIQVGPAQNWRLEDFDAAMSANFRGTLHCTYAALPHMRRRRQGTIVNITSIGGVIPVPHVLPYVCSKFASVGLSLGSAIEFARDGIKVLTVVPGLMRTGSFVNVDFRSRPRNELAWFRAGATMPLVSKNAERSAAAIVRAARTGRSYLVIGAPTKLARVAAALFPRPVLFAMSSANRWILPAPAPGRRAAKGEEIVRTPSAKVARYQPRERARRPA